jgi:hypothetical protein
MRDSELGFYAMVNVALLHAFPHFRMIHTRGAGRLKDANLFFPEEMRGFIANKRKTYGDSRIMGCEKAA